MVGNLLGYRIVAAALAGFLTDLLVGDPQGWPHIVRVMGRLTEWLEKKLRGRSLKDPQKEAAGGFLLVLLVLVATAAAGSLLLLAAWQVSPALFYVLCVMFAWQILSVRSLRDESSLVMEALKENDIPAARRAVSRIVGRDTEDLSEEEIVKAAVESIAENTADGVTAPLFWFFLLGPLGGLLCKAVSTMDSMVGYDNETYHDFGRAAAKADDFVNWIPSRICALFMIAAAYLCKDCDADNALRVYRRDRKNLKSPNAGQTESVCAGALNLMLGGDAVYWGVPVKKATLGDAGKTPEWQDIKRAQRILYVTSFISLAVFCAAALLAGSFFSL